MASTTSTDLAALDRVAHRLALLDTSEKLSNVLDKLLPRLLKRIGDNKDAKIHDKLVEMISHVLKRVRDDSAVKLPVVDLLQLLVNCPTPPAATVEDTAANNMEEVIDPLPSAIHSVHPLTFNLSLTFVGVGLSRLESHWRMLPLLLTLLESTRSTLANQQNRTVAHLLLTCMDSIYNSTNQSPDDERYLEVSQRICSAGGEATFEFLLDVLLYQPSRSPTLPPPGISAAGHERILSAPHWRQQWIHNKTVVLQFIVPHRQFRLLHRTQHKVVTALVVGTASAQHDIADTARIALKQHLDTNELADPKRVLTLLLSFSQPPPMPDSPTWRRRPFISAAVLQFCATKLLDSYPSIRLEDEDLALDVAIRQMKEQETRIKEAAAGLLRSVTARTINVASLSKCLQVATTVLAAEGGMESVRDACYGIVSIVARSSVTLDFEVVSIVFGCVASDEDRLRPRALAALDSLLASFVQRLQPSTINNPWTEASMALDQKQIAKSLLPTLWIAAQSFHPKSSRVAAAQWANDLLAKIDLLGACHLLCYLSGDSDAANIAQGGLAIETKPAFAPLADILFATSEAPGRLKRFWEFSALGKTHTLKFALDCLLDEQLYSEDPDAIALFLFAICESLSMKKVTVELLEMCSSCLLATLTASESARARFVVGEFNHEDVVLLALKTNSSPARRELAATYGELLKHDSLWLTNDRGDNWIEQTGLLANIEKCLSVIPNDLNQLSIAEAGSTHGALTVASHLVKSLRIRAVHGEVYSDSIWEKATLLVKRISAVLNTSDELYVKSAADALAISFSFESPDCPVLDPRIFSCIAHTLHNITLGIKKYGHGDTVSASVSRVLALAAGVCLAASTTASNESRSSLGTKRIECVESLFSLLGSPSFRSDEEVGIVVGEALSDFADAYSPPGAIWSKSGNWGEDYDPSFAHSLPPHEHTLYVLLRKVAKSSSPHMKTSAGPALLAVIARAARSNSPDKQIGSRCLALSITQHMISIQETFINLLADPKSTQFSRESCCIGLAACHSILVKSHEHTGTVRETMTERLLKAFGQTNHYGVSVYMETGDQAAERRGDERSASASQVDREAGVGSVAGMNEASLRAYKETAAACVSLGRHDLLYALLFLSASHPYWFLAQNRCKYGSEAFHQGATLEDLRSGLRPHFESLLPRFLRGCHDPNQQTRNQMRSLWNGLTGGGAESRALITDNFISIFDALVVETSSKLWRTRAASSGALVEIIVGRDWIAFGGGPPIVDYDVMDTSMKTAPTRLIQLWMSSMRLMDDVHGVVRETGATLARTVRSLTINLCDPNSAKDTSSGSKRNRMEEAELDSCSEAAARTALHWLVRRGFNQQLSAAAGICVTAIVGIVKVVKPNIVDTSLPELVRALLWAMSGLEPSAMNYLQFHVDDKEGLERARLRMTQVGPLAEALNRCIELVPLAGIDTQRRMASELDSALRQSIGFASRAAVADTVSSLCGSCPSVFTESKTGTSQLIKALYLASEREVGEGAKQKMVHALGNLASLSPISTVRSLAVRACRRYEACTGNNFDIKAQRVAAAVVRAIATRASAHMKHGGATDVWRTRVLPSAFLGKMDPDTKVAELWDDVWKEAGHSVLDGAHCRELFGTTVEEQLLPFLIEGIISSLQDVAWARRVAAACAISALTNIGILFPLKNSSGSISSKQQGLMRALSSRRLLVQCVKLWKKPRMWTGKAKIVAAAIDIAVGWLDPSPISPEEAPLSLNTGEKGSLFVGDSFFLQDEDIIPQPEDSATENVAERQDPSDEPNHDVIDFESSDVDDVLQFEKVESGTGSSEVVVLSCLCKLCCLQGIAQFSSNDNSRSFDESLPYANACFKGFQRLVASLPTACTFLKQVIFSENVEDILMFVGIAPSSQVPPVLVSEAIACIGSCFWTGMGPLLKIDATLDTATLLEFLRETGENPGNAWTVKASAFQCIAQLAANCHEDSYQRHRIGQSMVQASKAALRERKYWRVRLSGLDILAKVAARLGGRADTHSRRLTEFLLPLKEEILSITAISENDPEPNILELAASVRHSMKAWP